MFQTMRMYRLTLTFVVETLYSHSFKQITNRVKRILQFTGRVVRVILDI